MRIRYLAVADLEATAAAEYYEQQQPGLGAAFVDELKATEIRIAQHPNAWPQNSRVTRSCFVKRFPYSVIYRVSVDEIVIVAIHHHKRDPRRWEDRISE
jgi:plasmid stabilization system protein ParE